MTDKTDIEALREHNQHIVAHLTRSNPRRPINHAEALTLQSAKLVVAALSVRDGIPDVDHSEYWFEHEGKLLFDGALFNSKVAIFIESQLEVERQQREAAEAELAALRGEQEPVAWIKCGEVTTEPTTADVWIREMNEGYGYDVEVLCKRQPKPVVVLKSGYLHKSEVIKAIEGAGVVVKFETAGIVAGHNDKVDITCWSCRRFITFQQHAEADGFCPHCSVEIELDDKDGE